MLRPDPFSFTIPVMTLEIFLYVFAGILLILVGILFFSLRSTSARINEMRQAQQEDKALLLMQQQIGQLTNNLNQQLHDMNRQFHGLSQHFQKTTGHIGSTLGDVKKDMGRMQEVTREVLEKAVGAIIGAAEAFQRRKPVEKKVVAVTTQGSQPCRYMFYLKPALEALGYDVAAFHATGLCTRGFEEAIENGLIYFAMDLLVTADLVNEIAGGVLSAGKHRTDTPRNPTARHWPP